MKFLFLGLFLLSSEANQAQVSGAPAQPPDPELKAAPMPIKLSPKEEAKRLEFQAQYQELINEIFQERKKFQAKWKKARSAHAQKKVIQEASVFLEHQIVTKLFPAWLGTNWDFNGITLVPRQGNIACGYFVSTILSHAGFSHHRNKVGQLPSTKMIPLFAPKSQIFQTYDEPLEKFKQRIFERGPGLYIVGMDTHVGFLWNQGERIYFIHSSYYEPKSEVVIELVDTRNPLSDSRWRMVGKILGEKSIVDWIESVPISTPVAKKNLLAN